MFRPQTGPSSCSTTGTGGKPRVTGKPPVTVAENLQNIQEMNESLRKSSSRIDLNTVTNSSIRTRDSASLSQEMMSLSGTGGKTNSSQNSSVGRIVTQKVNGTSSAVGSVVCLTSAKGFQGTKSQDSEPESGTRSCLLSLKGSSIKSDSDTSCRTTEPLCGVGQLKCSSNSNSPQHSAIVMTITAEDPEKIEGEQKKAEERRLRRKKEEGTVLTGGESMKNGLNGEEEFSSRSKSSRSSRRSKTKTHDTIETVPKYKDPLRTPPTMTVSSKSNSSRESSSRRGDRSRSEAELTGGKSSRTSSKSKQSLVDPDNEEQAALDDFKNLFLSFKPKHNKSGSTLNGFGSGGAGGGSDKLLITNPIIAPSSNNRPGWSSSAGTKANDSDISSPPVSARASRIADMSAPGSGTSVKSTSSSSKIKSARTSSKRSSSGSGSAPKPVNTGTLASLNTGPNATLTRSQHRTSSDSQLPQYGPPSQAALSQAILKMKSKSLPAQAQQVNDTGAVDSTKTLKLIGQTLPGLAGNKVPQNFGKVGKPSNIGDVSQKPLPCSGSSITGNSKSTITSVDLNMASSECEFQQKSSPRSSSIALNQAVVTITDGKNNIKSNLTCSKFKTASSTIVNQEVIHSQAINSNSLNSVSNGTNGTSVYTTSCCSLDENDSLEGMITIGSENECVLPTGEKTGGGPLSKKKDMSSKQLSGKEMENQIDQLIAVSLSHAGASAKQKRRKGHLDTIIDEQGPDSNNTKGGQNCNNTKGGQNSFPIRVAPTGNYVLSHNSSKGGSLNMQQQNTGYSNQGQGTEQGQMSSSMSSMSSSQQSPSNSNPGGNTITSNNGKNNNNSSPYTSYNNNLNLQLLSSHTVNLRPVPNVSGAGHLNINALLSAIPEGDREEDDTSLSNTQATNTLNSVSLSHSVSQSFNQSLFRYGYSCTNRSSGSHCNLNRSGSAVTCQLSNGGASNGCGNNSISHSAGRDSIGRDSYTSTSDGGSLKGSKFNNGISGQSISGQSNVSGTISNASQSISNCSMSNSGSTNNSGGTISDSRKPGTNYNNGHNGVTSSANIYANGKTVDVLDSITVDHDGVVGVAHLNHGYERYTPRGERFDGGKIGKESVTNGTDTTAATTASGNTNTVTVGTTTNTTVPSSITNSEAPIGFGNKTSPVSKLISPPRAESKNRRGTTTSNRLMHVSKRKSQDLDQTLISVNPSRASSTTAGGSESTGWITPLDIPDAPSVE